MNMTPRLPCRSVSDGIRGATAGTSQAKSMGTSTGYDGKVAPSEWDTIVALASTATHDSEQAVYAAL
ncbi:hypothetical protein PsorP6_011519 [Peronosclerospora sorghi]|uniref:Uncharacterized protein n=1 Tax=Peronosclerospora sorghi TaxID=230839 RepID=A0ACC0WHD5_9STRA|nr:hypothetical protein PsorP6_011519 [Peronosclerospora sorghi]